MDPKYKKELAKMQFLLDEGVDLVERLRDRLLELENAIEEHKFYIGDSRNEHDEKLWQQIEDE